MSDTAAAGSDGLGLLALGWGLYLLEEHLIHRFVFHAPAPKRQFLFDLLYRLHYGHHDQQRSRHLLFTPLWFALPIALVTVALLALVMPLRSALIAVLGGSVCGYLVFEWLHLTSHFRMEKGRLGRYVTRRHAKHHNIDYHHWFTVSPGGQLVDTRARLRARALRRRSERADLRSGHDDPRLAKSRLRYGLDASLTNAGRASAGARGIGHLRTVAAPTVHEAGPARWRRVAALSCRPRARRSVDGLVRDPGRGLPARPGRPGAIDREVRGWASVDTTARSQAASISAAICRLRIQRAAGSSMGKPGRLARREGRARRRPAARTVGPLHRLRARSARTGQYPVLAGPPEQRLSQPAIRATAFIEACRSTYTRWRASAGSRFPRATAGSASACRHATS